jgi:hypothetical protein
MMEAMDSSETSVLTRAIRRHIPEDGILRCLAIQLFDDSVSVGTLLYRGIVGWWDGGMVMSGRAIAQAVIRNLPTAAARFRV